MFQLEKIYGKGKDAKEFIKELTKGTLEWKNMLVTAVTLLYLKFYV